MRQSAFNGILFMLIGVIACTSSCKKAPVYSCDEGINKYVTETIEINQSITRDSLAKLGVDTQFAIFNSLTSANKIRIYKEKFDLLLSDDAISSADKAHLTLLRDGVSEDVYLGEENAAREFVEDWRTQAITDLGWDDVKLFSYTETWMTPFEFSEYFDDFGGGGTTLSNCKCASRFSCGFGFYSCKKGGCKETRTGCGVIGWDPCTGLCDY